LIYKLFCYINKKKVIKISLISMHTNYDIAYNCMADKTAKLLDISGEVLEKTNPKKVIPIHTENPEGFKEIYNNNILILPNDKEVITI